MNPEAAVVTDYNDLVITFTPIHIVYKHFPLVQYVDILSKIIPCISRIIYKCHKYYHGSYYSRQSQS